MAPTLLSVALLLLVLAAAGGLLMRYEQPVVPVYLLLGIATRGALVDPEVVHFVQAVGIALLLFFIGLEFSVLRLRRSARRYLAAGGIDLAVNFPLGVAAGLLLGWDPVTSVLLGAALYISSSAIVARNVAEMGRAAYPDTEVALGVLVVEDLVMGLFLAGAAVWIPLGGEHAVSPVVTVGVVTALLLLLTVAAGPVERAVDRLLEGLDDEPLLLAVLGLILVFAGTTLLAGLSEAVGAFAAGLLLGDCRAKGRIERLLAPVHGLFAALFFFGFGLTIEAASLWPALGPGLAVAAVGLVGKLVSGVLTAGVTGLSPASGVNLGLTLSPRGEFSVVLAAYATAMGQGRMAAVVAVVVVVLAVAGTLLTRAGPGLGTRWQDTLRRWRTRRGGARRAGGEPAGAAAADVRSEAERDAPAGSGGDPSPA